jgi:hypothetical protein
MKKISTVEIERIQIFKEHQRTIGLDLGDRTAWRIDAVALERLDLRKSLQLRTQTQMISFEVFPEVGRIRQRARVFEKSGSHRCLVQGSTVGLPSKRAEISYWS